MNALIIEIVFFFTELVRTVVINFLVKYSSYVWIYKWNISHLLKQKKVK